MRSTEEDIEYFGGVQYIVVGCLQAGQPYHHIVNEVRCLQALLEASKRSYEAHHTYFPHNLLNRQHMAYVMACHRWLKRSVDEWKLWFQLTPPSEAYITGPCWC